IDEARRCDQPVRAQLTPRWARHLAERRNSTIGDRDVPRPPRRPRPIADLRPPNEEIEHLPPPKRGDQASPPTTPPAPQWQVSVFEPGRSRRPRLRAGTKARSPGLRA